MQDIFLISFQSRLIIHIYLNLLIIILKAEYDRRGEIFNEESEENGNLIECTYGSPWLECKTRERQNFVKLFIKLKLKGLIFWQVVIRFVFRTEKNLNFLHI